MDIRPSRPSAYRMLRSQWGYKGEKKGQRKKCNENACHDVMMSRCIAAAGSQRPCIRGGGEALAYYSTSRRGHYIIMQMLFLVYYLVHARYMGNGHVCQHI